MQTAGKRADSPVVVIAGANGQLGQKITSHLVNLGARPVALIRQGHRATPYLPGAETVVVDYQNQQALTDACRGAHCVLSALSGLEDVIIDLQTNLLKAAVDAGVPRFIPSDYSIDYTHLPEESNRNLDLRRAFGQRLDAAPIRATTAKESRCFFMWGISKGKVDWFI